MASNTNNIFNDTNLTQLQPDQSVSLHNPAMVTNSPEAPELDSEFLHHTAETEHYMDDLPIADTQELPLPDVSRTDAALPAEHLETDAEKLEHITYDSMEVLLSVETVLPPMIHPSRLRVDRQKLTIEHRNIWASTDTVSVQMDDINNVEAYIGPFFGEIRIYSKYFINNVQRLSGLWRKDAIAVRRLIQGYMIAHHKGIDCSTIEKNKLIDLLMELGRSSR